MLGRLVRQLPTWSCLLALILTSLPINATAAHNVVPKVLGMTLGEAKAVLSKNGFTLIPQPVPTTSSSLHHKVVRQSPEAGKRSWDPKKEVKVWYYDLKALDHSEKAKPLPPQAEPRPTPKPQNNMVAVPYLWGITMEEAERTLWELGLNLEVTKEMDTDILALADSVAYQEPPAGSKLKKGGVVNVTLFRFHDEMPLGAGRQPLPKNKVKPNPSLNKSITPDQ